MHIAILHNRDHTLLQEDPGREAREEVLEVAQVLARTLATPLGLLKDWTVELVPVDQDLSAINEAFARRRPDAVVNLCESLAADARGEMVVPAVLELMGLPYTGSGALALGLALHKDKAKELLRARGVPTPEHRVVSRVEDLVLVDLPFPLIVKPVREDASVGIELDSVVHDRPALGRAVTRVLRTFRQPALVERFIAGREVYVPLLGNAPRRHLPLTEIHFGPAFEGLPHVLSYRAKWEAGSALCLDSASRLAELPPALEQRCVEVALAAFEALDCRDYGRVDLRVDERGECYVIDINPNCDLHPQAGFATAAAAAGLAYGDLALHLVELALERRHGNQAPRRTGPAAARRAAQPHRDLHAGRGPLRPRARRDRPPAE